MKTHGPAFPRWSARAKSFRSPRSPSDRSLSRSSLARASLSFGESLDGTRDILIVSADKLTDLLAVAPAARALRRRFRLARVHVLASGQCADVLARRPEIFEVLRWDPDRESMLSRAYVERIRELRQRPFDLAVAIDSGDARRARVTAALSGAKLRLGMHPEGSDPTLNLVVATPVSRGYRPVQNLEFLSFLGIPREHLTPTWEIPEVDREYAERFLELRRQGTEGWLLGVDRERGAEPTPKSNGVLSLGPQPRTRTPQLLAAPREPELALPGAVIAGADAGDAEIQAEIPPPSQTHELARPAAATKRMHREPLLAGRRRSSPYEQLPYEQLPYDQPVEQYVVPEVVGTEPYMTSPGPYETFGPAGPWGPGFCCPPWMSYQPELFFGFSTFQDPVGGRDFASGGIQEGLVIAGPLSPYHGSSFEFGIRGVHTNLAGYQTDDVSTGSGRNQGYLTAGVFRRPHYGSGFQGGAAWDYLVDDFEVTHQTSRVRAELSYLTPLAWEFGFWGSGDVSTTVRRVAGEDREFEAVDVYALFVRRQLGGVRNRGWLGLTDDGEVILGGESRLPLGPCWALGVEGSRLFADGKRGPEAAVREGWALGVSLVYVPRAGVLAPPNKHSPVFGVAGPSTYYTRARVVD